MPILDRALRNCVRTYGKKREIRQPRITLSIDETLQSLTQTALTETIAAYDRTHIATMPDVRSHPAAIAVLGADTGDALALASYPTPKCWRN